MSEHSRSVSSLRSKNEVSHSSVDKRSRQSKSTNSLVQVESSSQQQPSQLQQYPPVRDSAPPECECGPDLYTRVLGPTADETILGGLQSLIELCNKLRPCNVRNEEPERDTEDIPERDANASQTDNKDVVSAGFQVNPSLKSVEAQTSLYPEMVSTILQTIGISPETASEIVQTSFMSLEEPEKPLTEPRKISLASIIMQTSNPSLHSHFMQTTQADLLSGFAQTSSGLFKVDVEDSGTHTTPVDSSNHSTQSEITATAVKGVMADRKMPTIDESTGDEHNCICPPEPPKPKLCKCCRCTSGSQLRKSARPPCICFGRRKYARSSSSLSVVKEQGGNIPGESPEEVKYAVTRISKYKDFTTFEIMKSTRKLPKHMPSTREGVFVLKKSKDKNKRNVNGSANSKSSSNTYSKSTTSRNNSSSKNYGNGKNKSISNNNDNNVKGSIGSNMASIKSKNTTSNVASISNKSNASNNGSTIGDNTITNDDINSREKSSLRS